MSPRPPGPPEPPARPELHVGDSAALNAAVEAVLALHVPWYDVNGVRHDHTVPVYGTDTPQGHVCRIGFSTYDNCLIDPESPEESEHYVLACSECRCATEEAEAGYLFWPCATVRAITEHIEGTDPIEQGRRLASQRDDLIAAGVDPAELLVPLAPLAPRHGQICPECEQGKHGNCDGTAWNDRADDIDDCTCPDPTHKETNQP